MRGTDFTPPKFTGTAMESFDQWMVDLEEYALCMQWTVEHKVRSLPLLLRGRAKQVYQDLSPQVKKSWDATIGKLQRSFGFDPTTNLLNFHNLDRVQTHEETVSDYAQDLLIRLKQAHVADEQHMMSSFYRGLLPNIKRQVVLMKSNSFSELEKNATIVQMSLKSNGDRQEGISAINETNKEKGKHVAFQQVPNNSRENSRERNRDMNNYRRRPDSPYVNAGQSQDRRNDAPASNRNNNQNTGQHNTGQRQNWARPAQQRQDYAQPGYAPFCRQCNTEHQFGQHTNPTCWRGQTRGHVASRCDQNF
jgi:hypothetical protein